MLYKQLRKCNSPLIKKRWTIWRKWPPNWEKIVEKVIHEHSPFTALIKLPLQVEIQNKFCHLSQIILSCHDYMCTYVCVCVYTNAAYPKILHLWPNGFKVDSYIVCIHFLDTHLWVIVLFFWQIKILFAKSVNSPVQTPLVWQTSS